jgi:hypothetical protein
MGNIITSSSNNSPELVAHTTGDLKEAIERTREAEAYSLEAYTRRFAGDKDYAKRYMAAKMRRASGR